VNPATSTDPTPAGGAAQPAYDDKVVIQFIMATLVWGVVGMLVGVILALQLAWWPANLDLPWTSFGRLRPLHTNAVIFAFACNAIFAGVYYSTQRLCKVPMWNRGLSKVHFWGWQAIIVAAAVSLPLGYSQGKEYAELIWPIDVAITVVWVVFTLNWFGTIFTRRTQHLYVSLWFYMASIVTIAVLHITNSLALPATLLRSYPVYSGMTDALVQWWYGHNAVGFVLTTPFLGLMYYFMPKAAERPVFSYRLSIIHFWALIFIYMWAGPHHLLYSSLPDWAQSLGVAFSLMLIAPSWGGMLNGLLTLRGAWDKVRRDPILKFYVLAVTFYGMSTFEGPMMSIRQVNALSHFTDWTIAHVHGGALGWVGGMCFGIIYWMLPRLVGRRTMLKPQWVDLHFWLASVGLVIYVVTMWTAGVTQGLQWRALTEYGTLQYPHFLDTVVTLFPLYWARMIGGLMYLAGAVLMLVHVWMTLRAGPQERPAAPSDEHTNVAA
jgi:cytochrome c oxidase cbb3-type subunit I/II